MRGSRIFLSPLLLLLYKTWFSCHLANCLYTRPAQSLCSPAVLSCMLQPLGLRAFVWMISHLFLRGRWCWGWWCSAAAPQSPFPLWSSTSQWLCSAGGSFGAVGGLPWPFLCWPKASLLLSARCTLNTGSLLSYHSSFLLQYNYFWCTQKSRERRKNEGSVLQWNRLSTKTLNHKHFLKTSSDSSEGAEETLIEEWHNIHP